MRRIRQGMLVLGILCVLIHGAKAAEFRNFGEEFENELILAIEKGDLKTVNDILKKDPRSVRVVEPFGVTPLHMAARSGRLEIIDLLVGRGAVVDYDQRGAEGTPLHDAVKFGKAEAARRLLQHGANIRCRARGGDSLLEVALAKGHVDVAKLLLEKGADPNGNPKQGHWPLLKAVGSWKGDKLALVRLLLDHGADATLLDKDGWSLLGRIPGYAPREVVPLLKQHGAPMDLLAAVHLGEGDELKKLFSAPAFNSDLWKAQSSMLLHAGIEAKHPRIVAFLLSTGAKVNEVIGRWDLKTALDVLGDRGARSYDSPDNAGMRLLLYEHGAVPAALLRPPLKTEPLAAGKSIEFAHFHHFPGSGIWAQERDLYWSIQNKDGHRYTEMEFDEKNFRVRVVDDPGGNSGVRISQFVEGKWQTQKLKSPDELKQKYKNLFDIYEKKNTRVGFNEAKPNAIAANEFRGRWMSTGGAGISNRDPEADWVFSLKTTTPDQLEVQLEEKANRARHADEFGVTPLHHAAAAGRLDLVKILVKEGADVNAHSDRFGSPLHYAVASGNADLVKWLLDHKADPSPTAAVPRLTPLHQAAAAAQETIVAHLLKAGAKLDASLIRPPGYEYATPLVLAAQAGQLKIVTRLWHHSPETATSGQKAGMALEKAVERNQQQVAEWLVRQGATSEKVPSIDKLNEKQRTDRLQVAQAVFQAIAPHAIDGACELGRLKDVKGYVEAVPGVVKSIQSRRGRPAPLHAAIIGEQPQIVDYLIEKGARFYFPDSYSGHESAWNMAAQRGGTECIKVMLKHLSGPDAILTRRGERPLHSAAQYGKTEILKLLLDQGANIEVGDELGNTALHAAAEFGQLGAVKFLLDRGAQIEAEGKYGNTALHNAVRHPAVVVELLKRGATINAKNSGELTPMDSAVRGGYTESIKKLTEAGAPVDLFAAVVLDDEERITNLLAKSPELVSARKFGGRTPLIHAAATGHPKAARILLKHSRDNINETVGIGKTALHYAAGLADEKTAKELVQLLLDHGAEVHKQDRLRRTAYDEAWGSEVREILQNHGGKRGRD